MNWVPGATAALTTAEVVVVLAPVPTAPVYPRATAAMSLGAASPKPQPPSRSCAMTGPAHFPLLKPLYAS